MSPRAERGLKTALVLGVALAFRALWLSSWPVGFSPDEAYGCRNAARFAVGSERLDPLALYEEGASQAVVGGHQPGLYYLLPVAAFRLLGYSPAVWRLTSVLPSLVTVLALYPFGRRALGERTAFLAALLLATSRWSASEARWGWHVTAAWGLLAPALVLFLRALRRDAPRTAAAAGLLGALPASFYPSAVAFALVPVPAALLARPFARRALAGYLLGALAGSVPSLVMAVRQPDAFLARGRAASVFAEASSDPVLFFVVGNLVHYAGLLFVKGDPLAWHTLPGTPALNPVAGAAFLAGLALALRRPRRTPNALLCGVLATGLFVGLVSQSTDAPNQYRIGLAAVAVSAVGALGLVAAARLVGRARRRALRRDDGSRPGQGLLSPARLPAFAVALSAGLDALFLLVTWPGHPSSFYGFGGHHATLARDVAAAAATGRSVAIHPALVPDRLQLDLALARTLEEAAAAGTRSRVPYLIARTPPPGATFFDVPGAAAGAPRHDPWGLVLYRVLPP